MSKFIYLISRYSIGTAASCMTLLFSCSLSGQSKREKIELYRVPEAAAQRAEGIPQNLARWHLGATLILTKGDQLQRIQVPDVGYFEESIFLSDNTALTFTIETGIHGYIIDLGQRLPISRFFLNNQSATGNFQLFKSDTLEKKDSSDWMPLTEKIHFNSDIIPSVSFPEIETRFIMIRFDISESGKIGNFGVTGPLTTSQKASTQGRF